jgi:hypothetical protein
MPDRVRIELFEAEDVRRAVNRLLDAEGFDDELRLSSIVNIYAEDLVNAIGEIYEAALIRMRRAALA